MDGITFAGRDQKDTLYKFRSFNKDQAKRRVREIVVDHTIYFSRRSQLNDPFDLAPAFTLDRSGGNEATKQRLLRDAEASYKRRRYSPEEIHTGLAILSARSLDDFEAESRSRALQRLEEHYWVFSLAGNRTHPMMWGHYADGHKGLCIHFSSQEPSLFSAAMKVEYHSTRPVVNIPLPEESDLMRRVCLWKGEFWKYEDEYRLMRFPDRDAVLAHFGLNLMQQKGFFKAHWMTGLTVGAYMPNDDVEQVLEIAKGHTPPLPVWRAKPSITYDLTFDQIA
jgi:hypothetical protein